MNLPALDTVRKSLVSLGHDAAVVSHLAHIRRITGFTGSNALLIISRDDALLLTDGRYAQQVSRQVHNIPHSIESGSLVDASLQNAILSGHKAVAVQGEYLSADDFARIESFLQSHNANAVLTRDWMQSLFAAKADAEIHVVAQAQAITDRVFRALPDLLRDGITERELAAEIVYRHLQSGAERMSFDPIVAFGENSALPHAKPTTRKLRRNEPVLIDMGCFYDGYASDMTRMLFFGHPTPEYEKVYAIVLETKQRARDAVKPGISCSGLDGIARSYIGECGYGKNFVHSLGHGVGLEIHEYPTVSARSRAHLQEGMIITIEPGIYIRGLFGIRLEDMVVVERDGCRVLTNSSSELTVVA